MYCNQKTKVKWENATVAKFSMYDGHIGRFRLLGVIANALSMNGILTCGIFHWFKSAALSEIHRDVWFQDPGGMWCVCVVFGCRVGVLAGPSSYKSLLVIATCEFVHPGTCCVQQVAAASPCNSQLSSDMERLLQLHDEDDDATSKAAPMPADLDQQQPYNHDHPQSSSSLPVITN